MPVTPSAPPPPAGGAAGVLAAGVAPLLQALGEVVVEQVPDRLALLARTVILSGFISATQDNGTVVVRTQVGDLVLRSPVPLPTDRVLTLQLPPGAPPVRAQVAVALPPGVVPETVTTQVGSAAPVAGTPAPVASPVSAEEGRRAATPSSAVLTLGRTPLAAPVDTVPPLLPGRAVPAQVLALPAFPGSGNTGQPVTFDSTAPVLQSTAPAEGLPGSVVARPLPPPSLPVLAQAVQALTVPAASAALESLLPAGLAAMIAHLPPAVLNPNPGRAGDVEPPSLSLPALSAAPVRAFPLLQIPSLPAVAAQPAFSNLPVVLTLPAGSSVTVQVVRVTPPETEVFARPELPPGFVPQDVDDGTVFPAVVVGKTPKAFPILTSPAGLLVLELPTPAPLPSGTRLDISLMAVQESPPVPESESLPQAPRDWPVLQQIVAALPPDVTLPPVVPVRQPHLGSQVLFLLAALGLKDPKASLEAGLGDSVTNWLAATDQRTLLARFGAEMQQAGQAWARGADGTPAAGVAATSWHSLTLPVPPDGAVLRLAVHMCRVDPDGADPEADPDSRASGQRLVVEVDMSRLGPLVLDGFVRPRRFDLTLRSQRRLPGTLHNELREAFLRALEGLGWRGTLTFQTAADLWLAHRQAPAG